MSTRVNATLAGCLLGYSEKTMRKCYSQREGDNSDNTKKERSIIPHAALLPSSPAAS